MFTLSCKYIQQSPILECINSIKKYHPNEKIIIVDSKSEDKSYFDFFKDDSQIIIFDEKNEYRQPGSFEIIYTTFPNESYYVMIHDSMILKKSIQKFLDSPSEFYSFLYFPETTPSEGDIHMEYYRKIFSKTSYYPPNSNSPIIGSFGTTGIIKNSLMKKFYEKGLLSAMKPEDKWADQQYERILGMCASQEGCCPKEYSIEGNFLERINDVNNDNLDYVKKVFFTRS